jgi:carbonic anhydrase
MVKKVVSGIMRFQQSAFETRKALFAELASAQSPEVLFLTCADSRIDPNLVTQAEPGDLFICRIAGNIVPPHVRMAGGVTASIEYAVSVLGVKDIIVCGHTDCGAMRGALNEEALKNLPHVRDWLEHCRAAVDVVRAHEFPDAAQQLKALTEQNVLLQLQHLRTHPSVAVGLSLDKLALHGWIYDIEAGSVMCYDDDEDAFVPVAERYANLLSSPGTHGGMRRQPV